MKISRGREFYAETTASTEVPKQGFSVMFMLKKQEGDLSGQSSEQGKWRNEFRMKGVTVRPGVYWKGCRGFCAKGRH